MNESKKKQASLDIFVRRAIPEGESNIRFDCNSLKIYMMIKEKENLLHIYKKTNLDKTSFVEAVKKLFRQGLIFRVSAEEFVSAEKVNHIKSSLASYVGPVAQIIVDDAFAALGISNNRLPVLKVNQLIEKITDQIPFDTALEFKKSIEPLNVSFQPS